MSDPEELVQREAAAAEEAEQESAATPAAHQQALLAVEEVARQLERTLAEVEELVHSGELRTVTVTRRGHSEVRVDSDELTRFREQEGGGTGEVRRGDGT